MMSHLSCGTQQLTLGIMLFDYQVDGLSAVYSFFDPRSSKNGLGNFMILKLINLAKEMKLNYVYLGYFIKNVDSMSYKKRYFPSQVYQDGKWKKNKINSL